MKARAIPEKPRPLLIVGRPPNAADLALRRILHAKESGQALCILDYQGGLASLLTQRNKGNLHKGPLLWCDLANRRRPTALFRFRRSAGMKPALRAFLGNCVQHLDVPVSAPTIDAVVDLAYRLADQGSIGLAALVRSLRRPEISQPLRRNQNPAGDLDRLIELLDWVLRFPGVWALSEGNNVVDLGRTLMSGGTAWIEMSFSHFERLEHQLVSWMVDAVLMEALLSGNDDKPDRKALRASLIVLYGFPTTCPLPMNAGEVNAKQVGLFTFSSTYPLPTPARRWLEADADLWVAGNVGDLPAASKIGWLDDAERKRLLNLEPGQVWVRSGASRKAVTMLARPPEATDSMAHGFRVQAQKGLRLTPIKQFSSALASNEVPAPPNTDLYGKLCKKETLYAGWFRVKGHNRYSHGNDRVTIDQFGASLEAELDRLTTELAEGRYRSRPLRTVRIPKPDGEERVLRVACVRDRVVQAACLHLIEPLFDIRFSPASFAYRPGRGAHHAVALARAAIRSGKEWVVTADIRKCFDSIDHDILLRLVGDVIGDRDLIQLLRHWLTADIIDFMDVTPSELGVPQGEAISPLLANIYLDPMDKEFEQAGITFVRYADDYLVLCDSEAQAQAALRLMGEFLPEVLRLALKPAKTHFCHVDQGIGFLGFLIKLFDVRIPGDKVARTVHAVGEYMETLASAQCDSMEKWRAVTSMNALVRGFRNYFLIDNAPGVRAQLLEMDAAVAAMAGNRFRADLGLDLVWSSRERFLADSEVAAHEADAVAKVAAVTGAYMYVGHSGTVIDIGTSQLGRPSVSPNAPAPSAAPLSSDRADADRPTDPDVLVIDGRLHVMKSGCYVTINGDDLCSPTQERNLPQSDYRSDDGVPGGQGDCAFRRPDHASVRERHSGRVHAAGGPAGGRCPAGAEHAVESETATGSAQGRPGHPEDGLENARGQGGQPGVRAEVLCQISQTHR